MYQYKKKKRKKENSLWQKPPEGVERELSHSHHLWAANEALLSSKGEGS